MLEFSVTGRPPKKDGAKSLWSSDEASYVLKLRESAYQDRLAIGLTNCFDCPVRLELKVFSPNILQPSHDYVSDLDSMIAGVFESIQPAHPYAPNSIIFQVNKEIRPEIPLIVKDDSQIISVKAEKIKSDSTYYIVKIEPVV